MNKSKHYTVQLQDGSSVTYFHDGEKLIHLTDAQWKKRVDQAAGNLNMMNLGRWEDMHWNAFGYCGRKLLPTETVCALSGREIKPSQEYVNCKKCDAICERKTLLDYIFEKNPHCIKCRTLWEHPPVVSYRNETKY